MKTRTSYDQGQTMVAAIVGLVALSILIPAMVIYTQQESGWTGKQAQSTHAFHLAEVGSEKAYLAITQSTATWVNLQKGIIPSGFKMDTAYDDVAGGSYAISISSGPGTQQATIVSVGIESNHKETRAIKTVYANNTMGNLAVVGGQGVNVSGNNIQVEWGAVLSPATITTGSRNHPQFWSAGNISPQDTNGAIAPNCDQPNCWQWHSYDVNLPPLSTLDFSFYRSSAQAAGWSTACGMGYYQPVTSATVTMNCTDTTGNTFFIEKNLNFGGGHIVGNVIVMGNFSTSNGTLGGASETVSLPAQAWKQYCNDWSYYCTTWDSNCPGGSSAGRCPGLTNTYTASQTENISPVVHGLLYVGGNFNGPTGGGNTDIVYGLIYVLGTVTLNSNSHVKIYYDGGSVANNLQTTTIYLSRTTWQNYVARWPSGLAY